MWDLPGPGLEPVSPALAGGFLTTESPGKSKEHEFFKEPKTWRIQTAKDTWQKQDHIGPHSQ